MTHVKIYFANTFMFAIMMLVGYTGAWAQVLMLYVILVPSFAFLYFAWKYLRFFMMPTPRQLAKGFSKTWPAVKRGPVVTRISRPRSSHTP